MEEYLKSLKITEDDYNLIISLMGDDKDSLSNGYIITQIVDISHLYKCGEAGNIYYKYIECLREVWKYNRIFYNTLETIEEYYDIRVTDCLIQNSNSYFNKRITTISALKRILNTKKSSLDFDHFLYLINIAMRTHSPLTHIL